MLINIDGKSCYCEKGEYLLDIAARNGIYIPTYCHNEGLRGHAACRVCIVEIETGGGRQVVTACIYPAEREMNVYTKSDKIRKQRATVLSLLMARAPESGRTALMLKAAGGEVPGRFTRLAGEKCILCGLCVDACGRVGAGAISTAGRGTEKKVSTPYGDSPADCIGCLSCASVCPTGAISATEGKDEKTIWGRTFALVKCESCGKTLGSREELEHTAKKTGGEPARLCDECRKKALADSFADTFRF